MSGNLTNENVAWNLEQYLKSSKYDIRTDY